MPVVAFVSPKGGAGKTTAALILALGLVERGQSVAMIDSDPNKPLLECSELPGRPAGLKVHQRRRRDVRMRFTAQPRRVDPSWIILDTEGSMRGAIAFVSVRPDLILTPLAGSLLGLTQAIKAAKLVKAVGHKGAAARFRTPLPAAIPRRSARDRWPASSSGCAR